MRLCLEFCFHRMLADCKNCAFLHVLGRTGFFCPCVLFGRNVAALKDDTPWTAPCVCHAIFVEGGVALAILTAIFHGVDPSSSFLIGEGLMFSWWLCSTYTGVFRQELQRKYHLKVQNMEPFTTFCDYVWSSIVKDKICHFGSSDFTSCFLFPPELAV